MNRHDPHPDFICIGLQKAATSWLYDQLKSHREAWMPPVKEFHFFDRSFNFSLLVRKLNVMLRDLERLEEDDARADVEFMRRALLTPRARKMYQASVRSQAEGEQRSARATYSPGAREAMSWYLDLFGAAPHGRFVGDITPAYSTLSDGLVGKIAGRIPSTIIVLGLRRPVERLWSQVCQQVRIGKLSEADATDPDFVRQRILTNGTFSRRSFPSNVHHRWCSHFGEDRVIVYFFEEVAKDPDRVRKEVACKIGLSADDDAFGIEAAADKKASDRRIAMPDPVRDLLEEHFAAEIDTAKARFEGARQHW